MVILPSPEGRDKAPSLAVTPETALPSDATVFQSVSVFEADEKSSKIIPGSSAKAGTTLKMLKNKAKAARQEISFLNLLFFIIITYLSFKAFIFVFAEIGNDFGNRRIPISAYFVIVGAAQKVGFLGNDDIIHHYSGFFC